MTTCTEAVSFESRLLRKFYSLVLTSVRRFESCSSSFETYLLSTVWDIWDSDYTGINIAIIQICDLLMIDPPGSLVTIMLTRSQQEESYERDGKKYSHIR